jgi:hypothetical protein
VRGAITRVTVPIAGLHQHQSVRSYEYRPEWVIASGASRAGDIERQAQVVLVRPHRVIFLMPD